MWDSMFMPAIPVVEKIVRPILVYLFLVVGLRLAGKRELAQLNSMDLVVLLTISNTVQNAIIGDDNSVTGGLLGATTLLAVNALLVRFLYGHEKIERIVEGEATTLIENGKILHERLHKELVTQSELEIAAHKQGFASLDQIEKAVLEASGVISFTPRQPPLGETRHNELTQRLDELSRQLAELKAAVAGLRITGS